MGKKYNSLTVTQCTELDKWLGINYRQFGRWGCPAVARYAVKHGQFEFAVTAGNVKGSATRIGAYEHIIARGHTPVATEKHESTTLLPGPPSMSVPGKRTETNLQRLIDKTTHLEEQLKQLSEKFEQAQVAVAAWDKWFKAFQKEWE